MTHLVLHSYILFLFQVRSLLLKWSQSILDVPTLVRLGYGGVPSPIVEKDEDDVSSWGSNNNNHHHHTYTGTIGDNDVLTTTTISVDERQQQRRRKSRNTSFTKALNAEAMMRQKSQHRSYSITAEEQDIIARLAATKSTAAVVTEVPAQQGTVIQSTRAADVEESPIAKSNGLDVGMEFDAFGGTRGTNLDPRVINKNVNNGTPVVRKVVKASRRLLTSFNFAITGNSISKRGSAAANDKNDSNMGNQSFVVPTNNSIVHSQSKKRTASEYLDANLSMTYDSKRPETIRRRNNIWAMNQRMKMRMKSPMGSNVDTVTPLIHGTPIHDNDDNNNIVNGHPLPQSTPSRKRNTTPGKSPTSSAKKQQRRTFFTDVEVEALLEGIQIFGVGKWSLIQKNDQRLQGRTAVQLKDKYRNIVSITSSPSRLLSPPTMTKD